MMDSMLTEQSQYSVDQINDFFNNIFKDLVEDVAKIREMMNIIQPENNPQVYLWLLQALIANQVG